MKKKPTPPPPSTDTCLTIGGHCKCAPHGNRKCPTCTCNGVVYWPEVPMK